MRVATRRQRAAWRVFGEAFRAERTKRYRRRLREVAADSGAVRDLDVLIEAAEAYRADLPVAEQRALEPLLADVAAPPRGRAPCCCSASSTPTATAAGSTTTPSSSGTEGAGGAAGRARPSRTASATRWRRGSGPRTSRSARYEPVLRWADVDDAPRAADRRQVAALHARVRPRGARARRGRR